MFASMRESRTERETDRQNLSLLVIPPWIRSLGRVDPVDSCDRDTRAE